MTTAPSFQTALQAHQAGQLGRAKALYVQILCDDPAHASALHLLGVMAYQSRQLEAAGRLIGRALQAEPGKGIPERHNNMGAALLDGSQPDLAERHFKLALVLNPAFADACQNMGNIFAQRDDLDRSILFFDRATALSPDFALAHFNRAKSLLAGGRLLEGWREFDWRWEMGEAVRRAFPHPAWNGEDPRGKTILIHAEQGMGDTIQFCRYLPLVAGLGATAILEVQPALYDLLDGLPGVSTLVRRGEAPPPFDWHCPLLDLPKIFGTELGTIPPVIPLPQVSAAEAAKARSSFRIGVAWAGNPRHKNDHARSLPLKTLIPLTESIDASWIVLQRDLRPNDDAQLAATPKLFRDEAAFSNFTQTATLISTLDLVITVDTSIAHLAGTLGIPTWILLPANPDWRWLLGRTDSPWYPSVRLFRQTRAGEWQDVIQRITSELEAYPSALLPQ